MMHLHEEFATSELKIIFVANTPRRMPLQGMEMLSLPIINLYEEVSKLSDLLPKILDVKIEVTNTEDTVRQLRADFMHLNGKFSKALEGLECTAMEVKDADIEALSKFISFRESLGMPSLPHNSDAATPNDALARDVSGTGSLGVKDMEGVSHDKCNVPANKNSTITAIAVNQCSITNIRACTANYASTLKSDVKRHSDAVTDPNTGAISKTTRPRCLSLHKDSTEQHRSSEDEWRRMGSDPVGAIRSEDGWNVVDNRRKRNRANQNKVIGGGSSNVPFKTVKKYVDVYVGRLELDVGCDVTGYIKEN